ncbi:MAG: hypothetical protein RLZZ350_718 [Verrucomicrobiota bacterium]|jgi:hypothetical protein
MGMFGFKSKKGEHDDEILQHWISPVDGFSYPPTEFYEAVKNELASKKIPQMEMSYVEFAEGGLFSDKRTYLRLMRERMTIDICAAPFGNLYFFSCRTLFVPPVIELWHLLFVAGLFFGIYLLLVKYLGVVFAAIALVTLVAAIFQVLRNTLTMGLYQLDSLLVKLAAIGPIYEVWFRKETYYRHDTRLLYLGIVPQVVQKLAEEVTAAKGVKLVQQFQRNPILGELYQALPPTDKP